MIYIKIVIFGQEIISQVKEDSFFSKCPVCGKETTVETSILQHILKDGDLEESSVYCDPCADRYNERKNSHITRIK